MKSLEKLISALKILSPTKTECNEREKFWEGIAVGNYFPVGTDFPLHGSRILCFNYLL